MKPLVGTFLWVVWLPLLAGAQNSDHRAQGYAYFGPGVVVPRGEGWYVPFVPSMHMGGGGEWTVYRGLGLGADLGYMSSLGDFENGTGTFSPNVSYRFLSRKPEWKAQPFISGGYTLFFHPGTTNGANLGGGMDYWLRQRIGLRFELRDNVLMSEGSRLHFLEFRFGVSFR